jgi:hypothetical protein
MIQVIDYALDLEPSERLAAFLRGLCAVVTHGNGVLEVRHYTSDSNVWLSNQREQFTIDRDYILIQVNRSTVPTVTDRCWLLTDSHCIGQAANSLVSVLFKHKDYAPSKKDWAATQAYMESLTRCTDALNILIDLLQTEPEIIHESERTNEKV